MESANASESKHTIHNKTVKKGTTQQETVATVATVPTTEPSQVVSQPPDHFRNLLDESARDAFTRPWFRLERGLRLNRLRMYVEQVSAQCSFTADEKSRFFVFLQNALDRKLLNTNKVINYIPEQQRIESIYGLEVRRSPDGQAKWGFTKKATVQGGVTRRRRKADGDAGLSSTTNVSTSNSA